jgi:hypothetical protein
MNSTPHQIRLRAGDITWREADGVLVVVDRRSWSYLSLNATGAALWPLLLEGATEAALVAELVKRFEVGDADARADVERLVAHLREHDLLADG